MHIPKKRPDASILLLTWNRAPMLETCLRELFASLSTSISREIVLMNNGSTDETPAILAQYNDRPDVRIVNLSENRGLAAYKKLFGMASGRIMIEVDDDVLRFPKDFDRTLVDYLDALPDYGYLALNVVQDESTDGAKPSIAHYRDDVRGDRVVEEGPTGGWCSAFRRRHYRLFRPLIAMLHLSMARCEDGVLMACMQKILRKRVGLVKNAVCLHATGRAYAERYGLLKREVEKYTLGELPEKAAQFRDAPAGGPRRLNLGCGEKKLPGYVNVDVCGQPDVKCDLGTFPWPFEDESADEILAEHFLEHVADYERTVFEIHRILKPNGVFHFKVPHFRSPYHPWHLHVHQFSTTTCQRLCERYPYQFGGRKLFDMKSLRISSFLNRSLNRVYERLANVSPHKWDWFGLPIDEIDCLVEKSASAAKPAPDGTGDKV